MNAQEFCEAVSKHSKDEPHWQLMQAATALMAVATCKEDKKRIESDELLWGIQYVAIVHAKLALMALGEVEGDDLGEFGPGVCCEEDIENYRDWPASFIDRLRSRTILEEVLGG